MDLLIALPGGLIPLLFISIGILCLMFRPEIEDLLAKLSRRKLRKILKELGISES